MGAPRFPFSIATMNFLAQSFREYTDMLDKASFFEHLFLVTVFSFIVGGLFVVLLAAVFCICEALHGWWCRLRAGVAVVVATDAAVPQAGGVWIPPAGAEQEARVIRRRRAHG